MGGRWNTKDLASRSSPQRQVASAGRAASAAASAWREHRLDAADLVHPRHHHRAMQAGQQGEAADRQPTVARGPQPGRGRPIRATRSETVGVVVPARAQQQHRQQRGDSCQQKTAAQRPQARHSAATSASHSAAATSTGAGRCSTGTPPSAAGSARTPGIRTSAAGRSTPTTCTACRRAVHARDPRVKAQPRYNRTPPSSRHRDRPFGAGARRRTPPRPAAAAGSRTPLPSPAGLRPSAPPPAEMTCQAARRCCTASASTKRAGHPQQVGDTAHQPCVYAAYGVSTKASAPPLPPAAPGRNRSRPAPAASHSPRPATSTTWNSIRGCRTGRATAPSTWRRSAAGTGTRRDRSAGGHAACAKVAIATRRGCSNPG